MCVCVCTCVVNVAELAMGRRFKSMESSMRVKMESSLDSLLGVLERERKKKKNGSEVYLNIYDMVCVCVCVCLVI